MLKNRRMDPISLSLGALAASFVAKAVEHAGERAVDDTASVLGHLKDWLHERFSGPDTTADRMALERVEDAPDSPARLRDLAAVIDERAARDSTFGDALEALVKQAEHSGVDIGSVSQAAWGDQNVQAAGITESSISVTYGQPPTSPES